MQSLMQICSTPWPRIPGPLQPSIESINTATRPPWGPSPKERASNKCSQHAALLCASQCFTLVTYLKEKKDLGTTAYCPKSKDPWKKHEKSHAPRLRGSEWLKKYSNIWTQVQMSSSFWTYPCFLELHPTRSHLLDAPLKGSALHWGRKSSSSNPRTFVTRAPGCSPATCGFPVSPAFEQDVSKNDGCL